jgi:hypothetical protein
MIKKLRNPIMNLHGRPDDDVEGDPTRVGIKDGFRQMFREEIARYPMF